MQPRRSTAQCCRVGCKFDSTSVLPSRGFGLATLFIRRWRQRHNIQEAPNADADIIGQLIGPTASFTAQLYCTRSVARKRAYHHLLLLIAALHIVIVPGAETKKSQPHQPTADQQREKHAAHDSDPAIERDRVAAEPLPGGTRKPERKRQQGK